jgi:NADH-quinone oxidoreductase subunit M
LRKRELGLLCVPALLVLLFGFFPNLILNTNKSTAEAWLSRLTNSSFNINDDYILQNQEPHKTALISGPM